MKKVGTTKGKYEKKEVRSVEKLYDVTFTQCYRTRGGKVITTVVKEVVATKDTVEAYRGKMAEKFSATGVNRIKEGNQIIFTTYCEGEVEWKMMSVKAHRLSKNSEVKEMKKVNVSFENYIPKQSNIIGNYDESGKFLGCVNVKSEAEKYEMLKEGGKL